MKHQSRICLVRFLKGNTSPFTVWPPVPDGTTNCMLISKMLVLIGLCLQVRKYSLQIVSYHSAFFIVGKFLLFHTGLFLSFKSKYITDFLSLERPTSVGGGVIFHKWTFSESTGDVFISI
jgi:hypothetical protein